MATADDYITDSNNAKLERQKIINATQYINCKQKVKYNHDKAVIKAKKYGLYYYKCNFCGKYHLTKKPTYESIMEEECQK